jgi:hypothetical protein
MRAGAAALHARGRLALPGRLRLHSRRRCGAGVLSESTSLNAIGHKPSPSFVLAALRSIEIATSGTCYMDRMVTFVYQCPTTGMNVQGWFADDPSANEREVYDTVTCLACTRVHLINRSTRKVLGSGDDCASPR